MLSVPDAGELRLEQAGSVPLLRFHSLDHGGVISHAVLTRLGGVSRAPYQWLNVASSTGDDPDAVRENRALAMSAAAMAPGSVATSRQMGGSDVAVVDAPQVNGPPAVDAMVTGRPGVNLAMAFADCLPIIVADPAVPALALVHAGWRGSVGQVSLRTWEALAGLGACPERAVAYFGPAIGPCCYEVGQDVARRARALGCAGEESVQQRCGRLYLDLPGLNARLLAGVGVQAVHSGLCTACRADLFYSHRAESGRTGRFAVYAGIA